MVGIAVISHGGLCEGILDSVSMVAGTMEQTESVSLKPGVSPDTYKEELRETIQRLDTGDGVVVFVDLMGGTPFNTICMLSEELNVHIVTGLNMAMLITAALQKSDEITMDELAILCEQAGTEGIKTLKRRFNMKAMRLHKIGDFKYEDVELRDIKDDEILMKVEACGICGSDIPRVFELGAHTFPITIGHEFSGVIVDTARQEDKDIIGKKASVFPLIPCRQCESCETGHYAQCTNYNYLGSRCDGGFAQYCIIPSKWHLIFSENKDVTSEALAMVEPATVAQHAVRRAEVTAGDNVLIFGAGPIGIMAARWAEIFGAKHVILVDIDEQKTEFAKERDLNIVNSLKEDIGDYLEKVTGKKQVDAVIEGTGSSAGFNQSIEYVKPFGTIALLGNPNKNTEIQLANHSHILRKEINIHGVWNSYYASTPRNEWKYTVEMMDQEKFKVDDLITHKAPLDQMERLFTDIYQHNITICKAMYSSKEDGKDE